MHPAPPEWPQVFIMHTAASAAGTMTQLMTPPPPPPHSNASFSSFLWPQGLADIFLALRQSTDRKGARPLRVNDGIWCHPVGGGVFSCHCLIFFFFHQSWHSSHESTCWPLPSTGSFHLIHLMFDDYVLYLLESLHCQERANDLMRAMKGEGVTGEGTAAGATCRRHQ